MDYNYSDEKFNISSTVITEFFQPLRVPLSSEQLVEIDLFAMSCIAVAALTFGRGEQKSYLDRNSEISLEFYSRKISTPKDRLVLALRQRYELYSPIIAMCYGLKPSTTGNPQVTLGMELYEMVSKKSSTPVINELYVVSTPLLRALVDLKLSVSGNKSSSNSMSSNSGCLPVLVAASLPLAFIFANF